MIKFNKENKINQLNIFDAENNISSNLSFTSICEKKSSNFHLTFFYQYFNTLPKR